MDYTDTKKLELAKRIYLYLGAIFITSLVVSNLIFQKFFFWHPFELEIFGLKLFELSVGILPYPITFLVTDLISEIYGKKKANEIVIAGILCFGVGIEFVPRRPLPLTPPPWPSPAAAAAPPRARRSLQSLPDPRRCWASSHPCG